MTIGRRPCVRETARGAGERGQEVDPEARGLETAYTLHHGDDRTAWRARAREPWLYATAARSSASSPSTRSRNLEGYISGHWPGPPERDADEHGQRGRRARRGEPAARQGRAPRRRRARAGGAVGADGPGEWHDVQSGAAARPDAGADARPGGPS